MSFALARIKRLQNNPYVKLMSDGNLYEAIDINRITQVDFNIDHKLDDDSWFHVKNLKNKQYCLEILRSEVDSKNFLDMTKKQFSNVSWIMAKQGKDFYFQKVFPSNFLKTKLFTFGDAVILEEDRNRLVVNKLPDAIYFSAEDRLIFRNLPAVSSIFKGIDTLYKEATDDDVSKFIGSDFISLANGYNLNKVSKPNRKRISMVIDRLDEMEDDKRSGLIEYISGYCVDLEVSRDQRSFVVKTDIDLKKLIYGLDERYYTTGMGNQRRLANSVQAVD